MNKEELVQKIKEAATAYYTGQEILQDSEYDLLIEELRAIDPENELIAGMASDETNAAGYKKMNHNLITGTLRKAMELNEFEKWVCSHKGSYHCSEKLDGQGFELVYENGVLTHLVSRGDGYTGFDTDEKRRDRRHQMQPDPSGTFKPAESEKTRAHYA
jgi:DNA ligase (NAD+)